MAMMVALRGQLVKAAAQGSAASSSGNARRRRPSAYARLLPTVENV